jgi:hypothetical protein
VIDHTAPAEGVSFSGVSQGADTVDITAGSIVWTTDVQPTISGHLSEPLAVAGATSGVSSEQLQISTDEGMTWNAVTTVNTTTGDWSYAVSDSSWSAGNTYTVQTRIVDYAGNVESDAGSQQVGITSVVGTPTVNSIDPDSQFGAGDATPPGYGLNTDWVTNANGDSGNSLTINGTLGVDSNSQPVTDLAPGNTLSVTVTNNDTGVVTILTPMTCHEANFHEFFFILFIPMCWNIRSKTINIRQNTSNFII